MEGSSEAGEEAVVNVDGHGAALFRAGPHRPQVGGIVGEGWGFVGESCGF